MENFDKIKSEIVNSILKKIYRTKKPFSEFWFNGLGNLLTYKYIMELSNGKRYQFHYDYICVWDESEKLIELDSEFKSDFKNKMITDLIIVNETEENTDGLFFRLENDKILYHNIDLGSELGYEPYSKLFDDDGNLI